MDFFSINGILAFMLVLIRNTGLLMIAPIFGNVNIPDKVKVLFTVSIAAAMFPSIYKAGITVPTNIFVFAMVAFKEMTVGLLLGLAALLLFTAIQIAGEYVSHMMGLSIASIMDPVTQENVPVVGQFYFIVSILIFLAINGHHWLFAALHNSYEAIPIGMSFPGIETILERVIYLSSQIFVMALLLVIPIMGVLFVIEVAFGFMAKVMPKMNIFIVSLPLKIYVGLSMMLIIFPMSQTYITNLFKTMSHYLFKLLVT